MKPSPNWFTNFRKHTKLKFLRFTKIKDRKRRRRISENLRRNWGTFAMGKEETSLEEILVLSTIISQEMHSVCRKSNVWRIKPGKNQVWSVILQQALNSFPANLMWIMKVEILAKEPFISEVCKVRVSVLTLRNQLSAFSYPKSRLQIAESRKLLYLCKMVKNRQHRTSWFSVFIGTWKTWVILLSVDCANYTAQT